VPPQPAAGTELAPATDPAAAAGLAHEWPLPFTVDVPLTLSVHRRGPRDPAYATDAAGGIWRTSLTPEGPATLRVTVCRDPSSATGPPGVAAPGRVVGQVWGPGAAWLLDRLPGWLGFHDDRAGFTPCHPVVSDLMLRYEGFRVGRSGRVFEALVPAVLEQKVVSAEAHRAWRFLLVKYGEQAPGPAPAGMRVPPAPRTWARIPSWDWHRAGVEGVRARTIVTAAAVAARLEEAADLDPAEADRRLRSLPGIGVWTSAEIRQRAMGDPDAVSVGDYHLPNAVGWTLARRKTDDAGMLELLAPYAGHRYRVTRLIELGGTRPERHGPRMSVRDYRAI
jgi:3-methyladenine DNA glycosylase/8-oxoguanine DNA glycosylase